MERLLLMGTGVVHGPDVLPVQADQADRLLQPLDEQGLALIQVVEVGDDDKSHGYFLPVARRREAGWLPRTSIQPLRVRVRITGCGWWDGPRRTEPSARQYCDPCRGQVTVRPSTVPRLSRPAAWLHRLSSAYRVPSCRYSRICRSSACTPVGTSSGSSPSSITLTQ